MSFETTEHWYESKSPHVGIYDVMHRLAADVEARNARWRRYLSVYMNKAVHGWVPGAKPDENTTWRNFLKKEKRLFLNPVRNCIDTLASRIATQKIRPQALTSTTRPDRYGLRRRAKRLNRAIQGEWYRGHVYRRTIQNFVWSAILGIGAMKVYPRDGRIRFEPTFPGQLIIDEAAFLTSDPDTLYQVMYLPAGKIIYRWPDHEQAIRACARRFSAPDSVAPGMMITSDIVEIIEAWHLPSGKGASDGRRVVVIDGTTLEQAPWIRQRFPFAWLPWTERVLGWFPQGAVEQEEPCQMEANKMLARIQGAMHVHAVARTFFEEGSIEPEHMTNLPDGMIPVKKGSRMLPKTEMPPSVSSQAFQYTWELFQKVFESQGVSMLSATSQKPPGIEAGIALRYLAENETGRHALLGQLVEYYYLEMAELTIDAGQDLAAQEGGYKSRFRAKDGYEEIDWNEIDLERDAYELQVFPASFLPHTPSGRFATIQEMMQAGFLDAKQAIQLLNFPDLEQFESLSTAMLEDVDRQIELMLDGKAQTPEPYQDLEMGLSRVTSALLRARQDEMPEARIDMLVDWLTAAAALLYPPEPETPPPPGGPGSLPPMPSVGPGVPPSPPPGGLEMPAPIPGPQDEALDLSTPPDLLE